MATHFELFLILLVLVAPLLVTGKPVFKRTEEQFPLADLNKDGLVSSAELASHLGISAMLARQYVSQYDKDKDTFLSLTEFNQSIFA